MSGFRLIRIALKTLSAPDNLPRFLWPWDFAVRILLPAAVTGERT
jgi:hypothetical protein